MKPLGVHFLLDVAGAPFATLDDPILIETLLVDAVKRMGAKVLGIHIHRLSPQGVSGVVVISESHLTIHTWPEYGYAAVDLFTCGEEIDPWKCYYYLDEKLKAKHSTTIEMRRGTINTPFLRHKPQPVKVAA